MSQRVQAALNAALIGEEDEVTFQPPENLPNATNFNPYLNYNGEDGSGNNDNERREYNDESRDRERGGRPKSGKGRDALERLTGVDEETAVAEATIVRARKATTIYTNAKIVNETWRANFRYQEDW